MVAMRNDSYRFFSERYGIITVTQRHGNYRSLPQDENIIVSMETGEVRLVDFGATAAAEKAVKKEFQGTVLID